MYGTIQKVSAKSWVAIYPITIYISIFKNHQFTEEVIHIYKLTSTTMYDDNFQEIECGHLICDEISTMRLCDVLTESGDYTFQMKIKSSTQSQVNISIINEIYQITTTTQWKNNIHVFKNVDSTLRKYIEITFYPGEYYFCNSKLEFGNIPSSWTLSLDDVMAVQSDIKQRQDSIEMTVSSKQDMTITSVRYIRDWLNGNNIDNKNYWLSCKIITQDDEDLIQKSTTRISGLDQYLNSVIIKNIDNYIDGNISYTTTDSSGKEIYHYIEEDHAISKDTGLICILTDLGSIHTDIDYIQIWHRFAEGNYIFNHKLEVSSDGVTWVTLYDSELSGGYMESPDGKTYYLNNSSILSSMNRLSISLNKTQSDLSTLDGNFSSLTQTVNSINTQVNRNMENTNAAIEALRSYTQGELDKTNKSFNDFWQEADATYATIASMKSQNELLSSQIRQDASSWEALFAELNMGDNKTKYDINRVTNITVNKDGITVKNPTTGQVTQMTVEQFCGWYENEKVFWLDKDTTKTRRLLCEKGWDTDTIKMTTNSYKYSNGTILKGTAYVKSGGSS